MTRSHPLVAFRAVLGLASALALLACSRSESNPAPAPRAHPREEHTMDLQSGSLAPLNSDAGTDREIGRAQDAVRTRPREVSTYVALGRLFVRKARESEDPSFYAQANDAVRRALDVDARSTEAQQLHALLLLQDHRFREARDAARALTSRGGPPNSESFGILSDAEMELGNYDAAMEAAQRMIDFRPDGSGYVRAVWLRWVTGDADGAVDAMRLALDALPRTREARAWIIAQAGALSWNNGDLDSAAGYFQAALREFPTASLAHAGLARVALARNDATGAVREADAAVRANPTAENQWLAADAHTMAGHGSEAESYVAALERIGQRTDPRTLSLYYSVTGRNADAALDLARREHENRQDVFTDDALAWAFYRAGRIDEAAAASTRAMRTGIHDARIVFHSGMIRLRQGARDAGVAALRNALDQNPHWHRAEADTARETLASLGVPYVPTPRARVAVPAWDAGRAR